MRFNRSVKEKQKIDFNSLKKMVVYCKPFLTLIIISVFLAIISAIMTIIGPTQVNKAMDIITEGIPDFLGIDMKAFLKIVVVLICLFSIGAIANYIQQFIMSGVTQKIAKNIRRNIDTKINKLPLNFFDKTSRGNILSVVTNDVDTISQTLGATISQFVNAIVLFLGVVIMMFTVNWILALVTIGASFVGFLLVFLILSKSQKYFNFRQENLGKMNGHIEEVYTNQSIVKSYNAEKQAQEKFSNINNSLFKNNWKAQALSGIMQPLMVFAGNFSYAMIFIVGVALSLNSNLITLGTIISFTIYSRLFTQPLNIFAQSLSALQQTSAASKRVFKLLSAKELDEEKDNSIELKKIKGDVEFKNVKFGYDKDKTIIKDFSINLKSGEKVAIVGPTGAGKTTIVNLLMRFYEVDGGDILVDGVSIKDMKRKDVRDMFDMILQDTWLFDGTIRENLIYNNKNITDKKLDEVCSAVGLKHFIGTLKNGYDTRIDSTLGLSEGQKQQLTIARAMIKNSPLLILDEATSSVDTRTEILIQKAMDNLTKGRTSFVIAHRLSTIKNADIILVLKDGDIIEQGNHEELLSKNGFYKELYNSQFAVVE